MDQVIRGMHAFKGAAQGFRLKKIGLNTLTSFREGRANEFGSTGQTSDRIALLRQFSPESPSDVPRDSGEENEPVFW